VILLKIGKVSAQLYKETCKIKSGNLIYNMRTIISTGIAGDKGFINLFVGFILLPAHANTGIIRTEPHLLFIPSQSLD